MKKKLLVVNNHQIIFLVAIAPVFDVTLTNKTCVIFDSENVTSLALSPRFLSMSRPCMSNISTVVIS